MTTLTRSTEQMIRQLAELSTDNLGPADYALLDTLVTWAGNEVARWDRAANRRTKARQTRRQRQGPQDIPDHIRAIVHNRSGGICEAQTPDCQGEARQIHHIAGRGWKGCHDSRLLLDVCGFGNVDGCHGYIHANAERAKENGWRMDRADAARLIGLSADRLEAR